MALGGRGSLYLAGWLHHSLALKVQHMVTFLSSFFLCSSPYTYFHLSQLFTDTPKCIHTCNLCPFSPLVYVPYVQAVFFPPPEKSFPFLCIYSNPSHPSESNTNLLNIFHEFYFGSLKMNMSKHTMAFVCISLSSSCWPRETDSCLS